MAAPPSGARVEGVCAQGNGDGRAEIILRTAWAPGLAVRLAWPGVGCELSDHLRPDKHADLLAMGTDSALVRLEASERKYAPSPSFTMFGLGTCATYAPVIECNATEAAFAPPHRKMLSHESSAR